MRSVPVAETTFPEIASSEASTLAALARNLKPDLAALTARRIGWLPSDDKSLSRIPEDLSTEAWVDRVISSIKSDATKFDISITPEFRRSAG